jgi:hypothetical protein
MIASPTGRETMPIAAALRINTVFLYQKMPTLADRLRILPGCHQQDCIATDRILYLHRNFPGFSLFFLASLDKLKTGWFDD